MKPYFPIKHKVTCELNFVLCAYNMESKDKTINTLI